MRGNVGVTTPHREKSAGHATDAVRQSWYFTRVEVVLYILGVAAVLFIVSGVLPRYRACAARRDRVQEFERQYRRYADAQEVSFSAEEYFGYQSPDDADQAALDRASAEVKEVRPWLLARRDQMQRDAQAVGRGVMWIAPPPMIGGGYTRQDIYQDLFDDSTNAINSASYRMDELVTIAHETSVRAEQAKRDLCNPWSWIRLAFARVVGFPRYVLRQAGFSGEVVDSTAARFVTVVWSFLVGGSGIGGFIVGLIALGR
jgi:hypothetical protein